jgi:hypothetical protein
MSAEQKRRLAKLESAKPSADPAKPWRRVILDEGAPEPECGPDENLIVRRIVEPQVHRE